MRKEQPFDETLALISGRLAEVQEQVRSAFAQIDCEALERSLQEYPEKARRLGDHGWTLPMWATPREVVEILDASTTREIDQVFVEFYEVDGGYFYSQMKSSMCRKESLGRWRPLLLECLAAYERELYLVVVPAMISIIEGLVAASGGPDSWYRKDPKQTVRAIRARSKADSFEQAIWISIDAFVSNLFQRHPFSAARSPRLNRAWILHGRDEPIWTRADCLRLFQAADTIAG